MKLLTFFTLLTALIASGEASASSHVYARFEPQTKTKITTGDSQYGDMLFNQQRQAIYAFDREKNGKSRCYGDCAAAWPPVLTNGQPRARGKARQSLLGTTRRKRGAVQVTYRGKPLYYYVDETSGQVFCHNVFQYDGLWQVVHPNGRVAD